jgi:hypothetical protein
MKEFFNEIESISKNNTNVNKSISQLEIEKQHIIKEIESSN